MPCNSEYLEPTRREEELQRTAKLLIFVKKQLGESVDRLLTSAAKNVYCANDYVSNLCAKIKSLTPTQLNEIVYNAKDRTSRDLANWWEDHLAADERRINDLRLKIKEIEDEVSHLNQTLDRLRVELNEEETH